MNTVSKITITSEINTGLQVLKHTLTATEKKILVHMINAGLNEGQVKNKIFNISKTGNNTAEIVVSTITKSTILGRNEIVRNRVKIKYS